MGYGDRASDEDGDLYPCLWFGAPGLRDLVPTMRDHSGISDKDLNDYRM
jgi:hypothetical protein